VTDFKKKKGIWAGTVGVQEYCVKPDSVTSLDKYNSDRRVPPHLASLLKEGIANFLPGMASNHDPPK
jgi:hypothetical protein